MRPMKVACFNPVTEAKELEFADSLDNYSGWVKDRIREHMDSSQLISPALEKAIQEIVKRQITELSF